MNSQAVYHSPTPAQQDHRYRYRFTTTADLIAEEEYRRWEAAEILVDLEHDPESWRFPQESLDFQLVALRDVQNELARRERLRAHPIAPSWPQRDGEQYQRFKHLALKLKSAVTIEAYCEHELGLQLGPAGKNLLGRCPFPDHDDRTPSFSVSPAKRLWTCHGCHRGGDIFTLAGQLHGLDRFRDQVLHIAEVAGLTGEAAHAG